MGQIDGCRFDTDRLHVVPWHEESDDDALTAFVVALLTPTVTGTLPTQWHGGYDHDRAATWIDERDAESVVLAVHDRASGPPVGLLILAAEEPTRPVDVRIGYLLSEDHWGRGFAGELVGGFVTWCRSSNAVRSVAGGVEPGNEASVRVLTTRGFSSDDSSDEDVYRLVVRPDAAVTIRPETVGDHDAIGRVVTAAFDSSVEAALVERIRTSPEYRPDLALVAVIDGTVVGHVMISGAAVRHEHGDRPIVMLSPLAVDPGHQRMGVGAELVRAAVEAAGRLGEPLVALEGDPAYYSRFGFEHAALHGLTLPLPDWAPSEAGQVLCLPGFDGLDRTLRGDIVYPVAFDGLEDGRT